MPVTLAQTGNLSELVHQGFGVEVKLACHGHRHASISSFNLISERTQYIPKTWVSLLAAAGKTLETKRTGLKRVGRQHHLCSLWKVGVAVRYGPPKWRC